MVKVSTSRVRGKKKKVLTEVKTIDYTLLLLVLSVLAFGLIMVQSAGAVKGFSMQESNAYYYLIQQLKWAALGIAVASLVAVIPFTFWRNFAGIGILLTLILLVMVQFSDFSHEALGAARWLNIADTGIRIQPSEVAKVCTVLFLAHVFDRFPVKSPKDVYIPGIIVLIILIFVFKQPDLGTTMVLAGTFVAMLMVTGIAAGWFFAIGMPLAAALALLVRNEPYQWRRILVWLNPWDYSDYGYQITNGFIAFGSGGLFGLGLGRSVQKYGYLPENHTDMIFAIVGEELGLLGCLFLISLFVALYLRCYQMVRRCPDRFGRLLGFGLTTSLAIQTAVNLAVVTGVFPVTGITLPLVSYGGNSLLITLIQFGIILNISRYRAEKQPIKTPEKAGATV